MREKKNEEKCQWKKERFTVFVIDISISISIAVIDIDIVLWMFLVMVEIYKIMLLSLYGMKPPHRIRCIHAPRHTYKFSTI